MLAPPPDPAAAERPADEGPTPMIPRYSRPAMAAIFEPENRFRIWLEIEALACEAQAELGVIPASVPEAVRARGDFDVARIDEIERETRHGRDRLPDQPRRVCGRGGPGSCTRA